MDRIRSYYRYNWQENNEVKVKAVKLMDTETEFQSIQKYESRLIGQKK